MSVSKLLVAIAVAIAGVATAIAAVGLLHELTTAGESHVLMHNLEGWVIGVAYHTALIVLAAAGVAYLFHKR